MAAANTDLLRKKKSNFSTTLSSSISDSDTTIPLSSASGLATDTAITLTIDRVDANGVATPSAVERVTGVVSGNNLTNCLRGQDGTSAAAHASGAVVEDIWDADTWNDALDAVLVNHDQAGGHKADAIDAITEIKSTLKTGSDLKLVTGTAGTTNYTAKWNADGDLVDGFEVLDEDDMVSDSAIKLATQQSIKAYVDAVPTFSPDAWASFTPAFSGSSGSAGTYAQTVSSAIYKVVDDVVFINMAVRVTNKGSWGGAVFVDLPVNADTSGLAVNALMLNAFVVQTNTAIGAAIGGPAVLESTSKLKFQRLVNTAILEWSNVTNDDVFYIHGFYAKA